MKRPTQYSISELASEFDVTTRTIRFYEEKGFLKPSRQGQRRIYSGSDRTRLRLILRGKRIGLSLDESAEIIDLYGSPSGNQRQLEILLARVRERREELLAQKKELDAVLGDLRDVEKNCEQALSDRQARRKGRKGK